MVFSPIFFSSILDSVGEDSHGNPFTPFLAMYNTLKMKERSLLMLDGYPIRFKPWLVGHAAESLNAFFDICNAHHGMPI